MRSVDDLGNLFLLHRNSLSRRFFRLDKFVARNKNKIPGSSKVSNNEISKSKSLLFRSFIPVFVPFHWIILSSVFCFLILPNEKLINFPIGLYGVTFCVNRCEVIITYYHIKNQKNEKRQSSRFLEFFYIELIFYFCQNKNKYWI
jgi:hypothetical protein